MKGKKTGGKVKGSKNWKTVLVEETARRLGCDPFAVIVRFCNGDWKGLGYENECFFVEKPDGATIMRYVITPEMRLDAAKTAVKYLYAQKQSVALTTEKDGIKIEIVDYSKDKNEA